LGNASQANTQKPLKIHAIPHFQIPAEPGGLDTFGTVGCASGVISGPAMAHPSTQNQQLDSNEEIF
jgi:hypothetical protein